MSEMSDALLTRLLEEGRGDLGLTAGEPSRRAASETDVTGLSQEGPRPGDGESVILSRMVSVRVSIFKVSSVLKSPSLLGVTTQLCNKGSLQI